MLDFGTVASAEMTYDANNRLLTYNGEEVKYDKDGNMVYGPLQGKMAEFAYDCRNRLVKAGDTSYFSRIYSAKTEDKFTLSSVAFSLVILSLIGYNKINDNILIKL